MTIIEGKNYLTVKEIEQRLNLSNSTVHRYIKRGKLETIELGGRFYITEESYLKLFTPKNKQTDKN